MHTQKRLPQYTAELAKEPEWWTNTAPWEYPETMPETKERTMKRKVQERRIGERSWLGAGDCSICESGNNVYKQATTR